MLDSKIAEDKMFLVENLEKKLKVAQDRVNNEKKVNDKKIISAYGSNISYGSTIMLQHCDSGEYLGAAQECSITTKIGYKVSLSHNFSKRMKFKLLPRFQSRNDGEPVQISDVVYFENVKYGTYLSVFMTCSQGDYSSNPHAFEHSLMVERSTGNNKIKPTNPLIPEKNCIDPSCTTNHIYLSQDKEYSWGFFVHQINPQIELDPNNCIVGYNHQNLVYGGDLVRIKHTENGAYLTADIIYPQRRTKMKKLKINRPHGGTADKTEGGDATETVEKEVVYLQPEHGTQQVYFKAYENASNFKENNNDLYSLWEIEPRYTKYPGDVVKTKEFTVEMQEIEKLSALQVGNSLIDVIKSQKVIEKLEKRAKRKSMMHAIKTEVDQNAIRLRHFVTGKYINLNYDDNLDEANVQQDLLLSNPESGKYQKAIEMKFCALQSNIDD
jgi:hypothetical protein